MTFLPIVERELRVSSRRKSNHYVRACAALLGMVIGFFMLLMTMLPGPAGGGFGAYMLNVLAWYALLMALLAGIFLASDTLSEERREGTLGLLFLTDLKGYDVVLGKFMAVSLNAFYGLLAVFPVLALCLLTGGVYFAEFWRTCLALLNLLFYSVAGGMLISSFCRSSYRAMTGAIALLVVLLSFTCVAAAMNIHSLAVFSPFVAFLVAKDVNYIRLFREYWMSLAASNLTAWIFLGAAAWRMRSFVDDAKTGGAWERVFKRDLLGGSIVRRRPLLDVNPVLWLLDDSRRMRWAAWLLALGGVLAIIGMGGISAGFLGGSSYVLWPVYFLLKILFAIQACRFFHEARRTGALELLFCTPLTMREILRGQWMLLSRMFLWPVVTLLTAHLVALCFLVAKTGQLFGAVSGSPIPFNLFYLIYQFKTIPNNAADFIALAYFGMWLALSMPRPKMAAGLTLLCVVIIPMIAVCVPTLLTDTIFIIIGAAKLPEDFRLLQAQWVNVKRAAE
ncbi:MAG TPA: ABC transporter permease subunit [Verrucomicrobiae bacterium]|jgi:ABC-type transport system involved in multi-copper enzyme maturation permease subunit